MKFKCIHCNINITDINKSVAFYQKALGLKVERTKYTGVRFACEYKIYNQKHTLCTTGNSNHCFTDRSGRPINLKKIKPDFDRLFKKLLNNKKYILMDIFFISSLILVYIYLLNLV